MSLKELSQKYLIRPFLLLATPICFLVSVYAAFVYGRPVWVNALAEMTTR